MEGNMPQYEDEEQEIFFSDDNIAKLLSTGKIKWDEKTQNFVFTGKSKKKSTLKKSTLKKPTVDIPDDVADDVEDDDQLKELYVRPEEMVKPTGKKTTLKKQLEKNQVLY